ncbi:MAG: hypothetical protein O2799_04485 [Planctomycetota bacterium]|nr:hypothetical protein [Planctomycetota bacterium]
MTPRSSTRTLRIALVALLALLVGLPTVHAQILRLTLGQMVERTDGAVIGTIIERRVTHLEETKDGPDLFFTTLVVEGEDLATGAQTKVEVSFPGGFVDDETGVWNSEAPSAEDQRLGNRIVAFWKETADMGGGFASNALYASHGGLFRAFEDRWGREVVLGRGEGYALDHNRRLSTLRTEYRPLREEVERKRKEAGEAPR